MSRLVIPHFRPEADPSLGGDAGSRKNQIPDPPATPEQVIGLAMAGRSSPE